MYKNRKLLEVIIPLVLFVPVFLGMLIVGLLYLFFRPIPYGPLQRAAHDQELQQTLRDAGGH
jgi:hypothetical protein